MAVVFLLPPCRDAANSPRLSLAAYTDTTRALGSPRTATIFISESWDGVEALEEVPVFLPSSAKMVEYVDRTCAATPSTCSVGVQSLATSVVSLSSPDHDLQVGNPSR